MASYSFENPLNVRQNTLQNAEDVEKLATQIEELATALANSMKGGTLPPATIERIGRLSS
jgi:hypothetical protein